MRGSVVAIAAAALALAGCAGSRDREPRIAGPGPQRAGESISLFLASTGFGTRRFLVTVAPDGRGFFDGQRQTAWRGRYEFSVAPEEYRALAELLAPLRPAEAGVYGITAGNPGCEDWGTDAPTAIVTWQDRAGAQRQFVYDYGCDHGGDGPWSTAINRALAMLPIDELVHVP